MSLVLATEALEAAFRYARKGIIPTGRTYDEIESAFRIARAAVERERAMDARKRARMKEETIWE